MGSMRNDPSSQTLLVVARTERDNMTTVLQPQQRPPLGLVFYGGHVDWGRARLSLTGAKGTQEPRSWGHFVSARPWGR